MTPDEKSPKVPGKNAYDDPYSEKKGLSGQGSGSQGEDPGDSFFNRLRILR
jgi:hypothetical protein